MTQGTQGLGLTSPEFSNGADIPVRFTCEGENINPQLKIDGVPDGTKGLALIVDDPDAAEEPAGFGKTFDHWIVFNIPPDVSVIEEDTVPSGTIVGANSRGDSHYTGPCPPTFKHRYYFKLYALNTLLDLDESATKVDVEAAMKGHILEQAELIGSYERNR